MNGLLIDKKIFNGFNRLNGLNFHRAQLCKQQGYLNRFANMAPSLQHDTTWFCTNVYSQVI